jgi:hypothetical protein
MCEWCQIERNRLTIPECHGKMERVWILETGEKRTIPTTWV